MASSLPGGNCLCRRSQCLMAAAKSPRSIAAGLQADLYIADSRNHRILHIASDGSLLHQVGSFADAFAGNGPATRGKVAAARPAEHDGLGQHVAVQEVTNAPARGEFIDGPERRLGAAAADEAADARVTLRLSPRLKQLIEDAAAERGESLNAWLVRTLSAQGGRHHPRGRRVEGTIET